MIFDDEPKPYDPLIDHVVARDNDMTSRAETEVEQRQRRLERERSHYNEGQKYRVSSAQIAEATITYTPTIINRDEAFKAQLPPLIVTRLKAASVAERELLTDFVGNVEAMLALTRHGVMPPGLREHFLHPLRGGGKAMAKNLCLMTVDAQAMLKNTRITPPVQDTFNMPLRDIQKRALRYLGDPALERIPERFIKRVAIGYPQGVVILNDDDFRLRDQADYIAAELKAVEALKRIDGPRERRAHRPGKQVRANISTPR